MPAALGELPTRHPFDAGYPEHERFPRRFLVDFATTHDQHEQPIVRVFYKGEPLGDRLTDNAYEPDGYSFHDVLHLSFAAVLGWSPLMRKLLKVKRKSNQKVDEVEDGARALYVEEALSTMVFAHAKENNWLEGKPSVSSELLRTIKTITSFHHLEVAACTEGEWERAIVQGFAAWRQINARQAGTLIVDLDNRSISVVFARRFGDDSRCSTTCNSVAHPFTGFGALSCQTRSRTFTAAWAKLG